MNYEATSLTETPISEIKGSIEEWAESQTSLDAPEYFHYRDQIDRIFETQY